MDFDLANNISNEQNEQKEKDLLENIKSNHILKNCLII